MRLPDDYTPQTPNSYDLAVGFLQVFDVLLNVSQVSNDVLLKELQHQNADYLESIKQSIDRLNSDFIRINHRLANIESQNEEILKRLGGRDD